MVQSQKEKRQRCRFSVMTGEWRWCRAQARCWMSNGFGLKTVTPLLLSRFLIPSRQRRTSGGCFFCLRGGGSVEGIVWQEHGLITLCPKNWPKFPPMPEVAGLYRITLNDGRGYIGEAQSLKRRLYEYRRPTSGIEQEHRVHAATGARSLRCNRAGDGARNRADQGADLGQSGDAADGARDGRAGPAATRASVALS